MLSNSSVGLLINNESNHASFYSAPLIYFVYIASGLNVVATDLDSHRNLPFQNKILYYKYDDFVSFEKALDEALKLKHAADKDINIFSMENRVRKIIRLFTV